MATLTYSHFGNPGGSYHRAHYSLFLVPTFDLWRQWRPLIYVQIYYVTIARASANLVGRGARRLVAAY